jgi:hypothetical protein
VPDTPSVEVPDLEPLPSHDRLEAMFGTIGVAEREGVLSVLPEERSEVRRAEVLASRIVTVRTRLHLLGYLRRDTNRAEVDDGLRSALRRFQQDAALEVDGWVGPQTWQALEQLVDFESDPRIDHWTTHRETHPAVWRAVRLRLFVFGLIAKPTLRSGAKIQRGLRRFTAVVWSLGLTATRLEAGFSAEVLRLLFDLDGLTAGLAREAPAGPRPPLDDIDRRDLEEYEQRFMRSVASIELWLRGIQAPLDGRGELGPTPSRLSLDATPSLGGALSEFWQSRGRSADVMGFADRSHTVDRAFFRELRASDAEGEAGDVDGGSLMVYEQIGALRQAERETVWEQMRSLGSRIWDGVKRVWRWVRSLIRRVGTAIRQVLAWARNLARLAYRYALSSFAVVRRAIVATAAAVDFILRSPLEGSDAEHTVIVRDADLDLTLVTDPSGDASTGLTLARTLRGHGLAFQASISLVMRLVRLVIQVFSSMTLPSSWFGLILALVRLFREIRSLAETEIPDPDLLVAAARTT